MLSDLVRRYGALRCLFASLGLTALALIGASFLQDILIQIGVMHWRKLLFDLDNEVAFYTWLSSADLMLAAVMLAVIATRAPTRAGAWWVLSTGFAYLSIDELFYLHERLKPLGVAFTAWAMGKPWSYSWFLPVLPVLAAAGFYFLPFLKALPKRTAIGMFLCGAAFLGGAIGLESTANLFCDPKLDSGPEQYFACRVEVTAEESLEGLSVIAFLFVLADYLKGLQRRAFSPMLPHPLAAE